MATDISMNIRGRMLIAAVFAAFACLAADEVFKLSSLVVPNGAKQRNPATEISVDVGDVAHLSPWHVKRRFPRSSGQRGGQLVTLRDALLALNETIANDDEMPAHAFGFAEDGSLSAICDVTIGEQSVGIRLHSEHNDTKTVYKLDKAALDEPVREFTKVVFFKVAKKSGEIAGKVSSGSKHKTGDVKMITLPGGATMEMIWCAPGSFMMGSPLSEVGRFDDEPIHPVTLTKGFWLGKYEVTQAQWESVMGTNRSRFKNADRPVDNVSWDDCQNFVRKVNAMLDGSARLPTEAEWEYACRAGSVEPVSGSGKLDDMAWYDRNSESQTHAVGKNQANAWGFYDMHGNVLEWCSDWFSRLEGASVDPQGPSSGVFRVLRGGCWFFYERDCRSAYRLKRDPCLRNCIYGFRLACSEKLK